MRKVVVGILIGLMLGTAGTLFSVQFYATMLAGMTSEHWPEYLYFLIQSLGVFAMIATVIVALFGNEIKSWIFSGRCEVSIEGGGFREDLGETEDTQSPQTQLYECTLLIRNIGSKELSDCELKLTGIEYRTSIDAKPKNIKVNNPRIIFWKTAGERTFNLRENDSVKTTLARIHPKADKQTPDSKTQSDPRFSLIAASDLIGKCNKQGLWKVSYQIQTPQKILKSFSVTYTWDGRWFNRINEMGNVTSAELSITDGK